MNASAKIPPQLRYDLRSPTPDAFEVPGLEPDIASIETHEVEGARAALREARLELDAGQISLHEYKETEISLITMINNSQPPNTPKSLAALSRISHTKLSSVPAAGMPSDLVEESPTGYLTPAHEDEYLSILDNHIATTPPDIQTIAPRYTKPTDKEREKDAQINNPVSVYNWLRAHSDTKPAPHDLDKEAAPSNSNTSEPSNHRAKPSPKPCSSAGNGSTSTKPTRKRASSALIPKQEPEEELLDEEGYVIGGGSEASLPKGKRKRDNDDAYRPKGGSSKSRKRTKGSGGAAVKKLEPEVEEEEEEYA